MNLSRREVSVGAGILLLVTLPLPAQQGRLRVRVLDSAGSPIPAAEVSSLSGKDRKPRTTDKNGVVVFTQLPEGNLRISVSAPEFNLRVVEVAIRRTGETDTVVELESDGSRGILNPGNPTETAPSAPPVTSGGRVQLRVVTSRRKYISNAEVSVIGADGKPQRASLTNARGQVVLPFLAVGRYRVVAQAPGFRKKEANITVRDDNPIELPIVLETN